MAAKKIRISIITPCLNALDFLKDTVFSVLSQKALMVGQVELEYIFCDGGSTDGTLEWLESLNYSEIRLIAEKDKGLYDALSKGLTVATGDIVAYLNAGDYYSPYAFNILYNVFADPNVKWITGYSTWYNQKGYLVSALLPYRYRRAFIQKGFYGYLIPWMWIQQESTFWRTELLTRVDFEKFSGLKYAGDYYLWRQFSKVTDLHIVKAHIGGFRKHPEQLSENKKGYNQEIASFVNNVPSVADYIVGWFDTMIWYMPDRVKLALNPKIIQL